MKGNPPSVQLGLRKGSTKYPEDQNKTDKMQRWETKCKSIIAHPVNFDVIFVFSIGCE